MKVQDVELVGPLPHLLQHDDVIGQTVPDTRIEAKRDIATARQFSGSLRIAASKQRDIVSLADKFFGQVGNDTFRSPIELRWNAFVEWSNLSDPHRQGSPTVVQRPNA